MGWKKILSKHVFDKRLVSRIYRQFLQLNKTNNPINATNFKLSKAFMEYFINFFIFCMLVNFDCNATENNENFSRMSLKQGLARN